MAVILNFGEFEYILEEDRDLPPEQQTVFILRPLTFREREQVTARRLEQAEGGAGMAFNPMETARKVLNAGLMDWRNLRNADGEEVVLETRATRNGHRELSEKTLDAISYWAVELANAIDERSRLSEGARKNSG